jgi:hypothetical protein
MTCTLARFIYEDPILLAMARGTIDWADTFTEEDELALQEYNTIGEGAAILASLKAFMDSSIDSDVDAEAEEFEELLRTPRTVRTVRWADEVTVTGMALPVTVATVAVATPTAAPITIVTPVALVVPVGSTDDGFQVVSKAPKAPKVEASQQAQQASQAQVNPRSIRTIIARNLPRTITDLELRKRFGAHGAVQDIYIPKNTTPGKYFGTIKGFALIKFHTHKDSTKVFLAEKDALFLGGNAVTLEFANQDR